jgi:hypothetical protein
MERIMWYEKKKEALNFDLPIFAETITGETELYLLMPQICKSDYTIIGYNWFRLKDGRYNSSSFFKTASEAIECYQCGHKIFNGEIVVNQK